MKVLFKNLPKRNSTSKINKKPSISVIKSIQTEKEGSNTKAINTFNILLHAPFYLLCLPLGLSYTNIIPIPVLVDLARLSLRTFSFIQAVNSGVNISSIINDKENELKERIRKENDIEEEEIKVIEKKLESRILMCISPAVLNFISTQVLLNSAVLTNDIIMMGFTGMVSANLLNLVVILKQVNVKKEKNVLIPYFRTNLTFVILNMLILLFVFNFILNNKNSLKRPHDPNRLENLLTKEELVLREVSSLEEEIIDLYENSSPEDLRKIERIYEA